jgi:hypothetical protein
MPTTSPHSLPSISCVRTKVPEKHASMTTMLKHFKPHHAPSANTLDNLTISPAVQAIIVDCVSVVNPQLTPIIRDNAETIM